MDHVFLDANVLFSAAYSEVNGLLQLWHLADVELITSQFAATEAERNLEDEAQRQRLATLLLQVRVIDSLHAIQLPPGVVLPDKDVPILSAAIESHATHLLTGDKRHFGPLFGMHIAGVLVEAPSTYLARRNSTSAS